MKQSCTDGANQCLELTHVVNSVPITGGMREVGFITRIVGTDGPHFFGFDRISRHLSMVDVRNRVTSGKLIALVRPKAICLTDAVWLSDDNRFWLGSDPSRRQFLQRISLRREERDP